MSFFETTPVVVLLVHPRIALRRLSFFDYNYPHLDLQSTKKGFALLSFEYSDIWCRASAHKVILSPDYHSYTSNTIVNHP